MSLPGPDRLITDRNEFLIRRGLRNRKLQKLMVRDAVTGCVRPPAVVFEPRAVDQALSVNVLGLLLAAGLPALWRVKSEFYAVKVAVGACNDCGHNVCYDPIEDDDPEIRNPYHGLILGLVELKGTDPEAFDKVLDKLARASEVISDT